MHRVSWTILLSIAGAFGCGGDSSQGGAAACPDVSGTFTIRSHCTQALVGTQVTVEQTACNFTTSGAFAGLQGTLAKDGSFTLAGTLSGVPISCTGTASSQHITERCTGDCDVTLDR